MQFRLLALPLLLLCACDVGDEYRLEWTADSPIPSTEHIPSNSRDPVDAIAAIDHALAVLDVEIPSESHGHLESAQSGRAANQVPNAGQVMRTRLMALRQQLGSAEQADLTFKDLYVYRLSNGETRVWVQFQIEFRVNRIPHSVWFEIEPGRANLDHAARDVEPLYLYTVAPWRQALEPRLGRAAVWRAWFLPPTRGNEGRWNPPPAATIPPPPSPSPSPSGQ